MQNPQDLIILKVREAFEKARTKNSSLSLRAFAKKGGVSSGALSDLLAGKRRISRKLALRLSESFLLDPKEIKQIAEAFADKSFTKTPLEYSTLAADQHALIVDWVHYAILSLVKLKNFQEDPAWISNRLGVARKESKMALDRLIKLGLLVRKNSGRLQRSQTRFSTSDGPSNVLLRRAHLNNLELAAASLNRDHTEMRDFSSVTMAIDPKKIHEAKRRIRDFQDSLASFLEQGRQSEVYRLCVQLFPLTQLEKDISK